MVFPDLVGGLPLKFDFALFNENEELVALVEYQGEQHFEAVEFLVVKKSLSDRE